MLYTGPKIRHTKTDTFTPKVLVLCDIRELMLLLSQPVKYPFVILY